MTQTLGIIGAGSIGGTVAQAFDELGYDVFINDTDPERVAALDLPAREKSWLGAHCDVVMVAVPTPTGEDGGDASIVEQAVRPLRDADATVCIRSTMPPGETSRIAETLDMSLVYAPEFMRDRAGVADFFERDRLVFAGPDSHRSRVRELFDDPQLRVTAVFECEEYLTAEIAKEAHNAFFATKVSFANQMRLLAERVGANPETIMNIIIADSRNTDSHLDPMLGPYGGKCLPKDTQALTHFASEQGVPTPLLEGTINTNAEARDRFENLDIEGRWPHIEVQSD